ncbi:MAG: AmmeMemoRadiSam system protein B [Methyloceanibacter sp.]
MSAPEPTPELRRPAVAGSFYPPEAAELEATVDALLSQASKCTQGELVGVVAPHAGYFYSGPVAASAFAVVGASAQAFERVLLLGPPHYVPIQVVAATSSQAFATPLGEVEIDTDAIAMLYERGLVKIDDGAHAPEHSLEVELPFLQRVLGRFKLIPLLVGDASPRDVASVINAVMDDRTLLVVSTDLSHYLDDASAKARDLASAESIERLDFTALGPYDACGFAALNATLYAGREAGWRIERLDLRNSGDTSGDRGRVVGYGAWVFSQPPPGAA